jgi:hypothetical protein
MAACCTSFVCASARACVSIVSMCLDRGARTCGALVFPSRDEEHGCGRSAAEEAIDGEGKRGVGDATHGAAGLRGRGEGRSWLRALPERILANALWPQKYWPSHSGPRK